MDLPDQVKALLINGEVILFIWNSTVLDLPSCIWNTLYMANQDSSIYRQTAPFLVLI